MLVCCLTFVVIAISTITGVPLEQLNRPAIIFRPARTAMQSGLFLFNLNNLLFKLLLLFMIIVKMFYVIFILLFIVCLFFFLFWFFFCFVFVDDDTRIFFR
jgi:hypothetical protein